MRFEVPQFIEIEDKIFGPLTWRQFVYLGGGVGAAVVMFLVFPFIVFVLLGLPIGLLAAALAFFPVNNRPFSYFLEAVYNYITNDKLYLWHQKADVIFKEPTKLKTASTTVSPSNRGSKHKSITSLTRALELQAMQKPE
ncbi:MAG: hypothetical protein ACI9SY_000386 [Candidatus Paceibacteria bacterium]|jgi:hypothetical protein